MTTYHEYLETPEWIARAEEVRSRNDGMCECCHMRFSAAAHHRTYERLGAELDEDLIGLCETCHSYIHGFIEGIVIWKSRLSVLGELRKEVKERGLRDERSN